jgi:hypothetical protein
MWRLAPRIALLVHGDGPASTQHQPPGALERYLATQAAVKEDFESLLMDSFLDNEPMEGAVVKGTVVAI